MLKQLNQEKEKILNCLTLLFYYQKAANTVLKNLKKKQIKGPKSHVKKYFITGEKIFGISTSLLFVLLVMNYLIELAT